ncbi:hypothetical protein ORV05_14230 [Amycolatopsis cynarae]|uniref:Alpha/beta hydrolase n=1 Tax=Amycolatopsis cynarae TaxID=2995223 RepID=A0ABY7B939_9PSEU|nr:hypothetical protein [Amycolatopsis sp. HUAS 11-8]WAL68869.1 hypothetical protein ORV05_14230 [Amycolatopsis sp. HUAS 11-8]
MTTIGTRLRLRTWDAADPAAPRGTVAVFPGRGEHTGVYARLAARLSAEGYRIQVVEPGSDGHDDEIRDWLSDLRGPLFLLGTDTGALSAARHAEGAAAVVLAGVPGEPDWEPPANFGWRDEIALRAADPARRAALRSDPLMRPGELLHPVSEPLDPPSWVPTLVLHGEADLLSPSLPLRQRVVGRPRLRFVTVAASGHDVLHDTHERSVAAEILQFLERFRAGGEAVLRPSIRSTL